MTEGQREHAAEEARQKEIEKVLLCIKHERRDIAALRHRLEVTERELTTSNIRMAELKKMLHRLSYKGNP